jgi:transcriptional regulator with XRE-family HTH domain
METSFIDWLRNELRERGWTQAELARRSGISPAHITKALNGERGFGEQSIRAIANAFNLPAEHVFRMAGVLPPVSAEKSKMAELSYLLNMLDDDDLDELIRFARFRLEDKEKKKPSRSKRPARSALKDN